MYMGNSVFNVSVILAIYQWQLLFQFSLHLKYLAPLCCKLKSNINNSCKKIFRFSTSPVGSNDGVLDNLTGRYDVLVDSGVNVTVITTAGVVSILFIASMSVADKLQVKVEFVLWMFMQPSVPSIT